MTQVSGSTITIPSGLAADVNAAGATAVVVAGPGAGQWRAVVAQPSSTTLTLAAPLDDNVVLGETVIAVIFSSGGKVVVDNHFSWGMVVQLFGSTLTAVFADNTLDNQNNINPDGTAMDGAFVIRKCSSVGYGRTKDVMHFSQSQGL